MYAARKSMGWEVSGNQVKDDKGIKCRGENWRPISGVDVQVYRHYTPGRVGGEKRVKQREVEQHRMVTNGGREGVRSGGGNKDPEHS